MQQQPLEPKRLDFQPGEYTTVIFVEIGEDAIWYLVGFGVLAAIGIFVWIRRRRRHRTR